jgi:hypothetical protein
LPEGAIDGDLALLACAPMGTLESIVVSRAARNAARTCCLIVPDPAIGAEYERLGISVGPGCRALVDAAALMPRAVLSLPEPHGRALPQASSANGSDSGLEFPGD